MDHNIDGKSQRETEFASSELMIQPLALHGQIFMMSQHKIFQLTTPSVAQPISVEICFKFFVLNCEWNFIIKDRHRLTGNVGFSALSFFEAFRNIFSKCLACAKVTTYYHVLKQNVEHKTGNIRSIEINSILYKASKQQRMNVRLCTSCIISMRSLSIRK